LMEKWMGSVHSRMTQQTHFLMVFIAFWKRALHVCQELFYDDFM